MLEYPFNHIGFQAHLDEKRLVGARCTACGTLFVPPHTLCTHCYSTDMEWQTLSGAGRLAAFTVIHIALPFMAAEGYHPQNPYCSGVVQLAEGPAISAQIIDVDVSHPESIQIGNPLQAVFIQRGAEGQLYLAFSPIDGEQDGRR
jgi:uncharacterized protein